jgi:uncharacterized protein (DUF2147 family)
VIVVLGFAWISLPLGIFTKFALVLVSSLGLTLAMYELIVRRNAVLRILHGMRVRSAPVTRGALYRAAAQMLIVGCLVFASVLDARSAPIEGRWWADGGFAQVEITERSGELVGRVVWLRSPFDEHGCPLVDSRNPDPALRTRSVEGLELLSGLRRDATDTQTWTGGRIYDPGSGRSYRLAVRMEGADRLVLRGFIGFELIGQTRTWFRVREEGDGAPICASQR